jgi:hypothetical protein
MGCCCGVETAASLAPPIVDGIDDYGVMFLYRTVAVPALPIDPAWQASFGHASFTRMRQVAGPAADINGADAPAGGSPAAANTTTFERQHQGDVMQPGTSFGGSTLWRIQFFANATPSARILAFTGLRIFNGVTPVATLLPVANYNGVVIPGSNTYQTLLVRQPLAAYVSQPGDFPVLETGARAPEPITGFASIHGSRAIAAPSVFEMSLHVMGFDSTNPGARRNYLEFDGVVFP